MYYKLNRCEYIPEYYTRNNLHHSGKKLGLVRGWDTFVQMNSLRTDSLLYQNVVHNRTFFCSLSHKRTLRDKYGIQYHLRKNILLADKMSLTLIKDFVRILTGFFNISI